MVFDQLDWTVAVTPHAHMYSSTYWKVRCVTVLSVCDDFLWSVSTCLCVPQLVGSRLHIMCTCTSFHSVLMLYPL